MAPARDIAAGGERVVAIAFDGMAPFELGIVVEVFGLRRPEVPVPWYDFAVCSPDPGPLRAVGGFSIVADHGIDAVRTASTVIVPAWPHVGERVPAGVLDALREARDAGARIVSICSGAFVLAAAGLLDGRRTATHWRYADALRRLHPRVVVDERVLYVDDGDVLTSAGSAAGIDLCLHIVRADHGSAVANQVARRLVVSPHREGDQAQFIDRPVAEPDDARLQAAMDWVLGNLSAPITVADLAARSYMSVRTFSRHFRLAVGTSPMAWVIEQRIRASTELLETSSHPVEWIGRLTGFPTSASFRRHFRRAVGVSPSQYRRSFAALEQRIAA